MPLLKFQTFARVKCSICHCDLVAQWNEEYATMSVAPCYDCMENAKLNALEDRSNGRTFTSPLRFENVINRCAWCGNEIQDVESIEGGNGMHLSCRALGAAELRHDAKKEGAA